jgi:hypothetical protein
MDESGDLGFDFQKERTSRYFVVSCLIIHSPKSANKIVERILAGMSKKERKINHGILHFYHIAHSLRIKILKQIADLDCKIATIRVNKPDFP